MNREEISQRLKELENEKRELLRQLQNSLPKADSAKTPRKTLHSFSTDEKIKIFTDLFRCRVDVYPEYWRNSKKNSQGYSPACRNEWKPGVCEKPRVKCAECSHQSFIELDSDVIRSHLEGDPPSARMQSAPTTPANFCP